MPTSQPQRPFQNILSRFGLSSGGSAAAIDGGTDCLILLDVSTSMDANMSDGTPKLEAAKSATIAISEERARQDPRNRVAVLTYGDDARVELNWQGGDGMVDTIQRGVRSIRTRGCTNIGAGLNQAATLLGAGNRPSLVFLLSDGCNNAGGDPEPLAQRLKQKGIYIATRGFGPAPNCVDVPLMMAMASTRHDGDPDYEFWEARSLGHIVEQARKVGRICLPSAS